MNQLTINKAAGGTLNLFGFEPARGVVKAQLSRQMLGEDRVSIKVESSRPLSIGLGDWMSVFGSYYVFNEVPNARKEHSGFFTYDLLLDGLQYNLQRVIYFNQDVSGTATGGEFSLTGDLATFLGVLMTNVGRALTGWSLGTVVPTSTKTLSFSNEDCLAVLQRLCQEFQTEFEIIPNGGTAKVLHVHKIGQILPTVFAYGPGRGLYKLERQTVSDANFINRLYPYGGSKNIPSLYRGGGQTRLLIGTPPANYVENATSIAALGLQEGTKIWEDIYPHRTGTVSALGSDKLTFVDGGMNFDVNAQLMPGVTAKVHFNTGNLAGYEFEIKSYTPGNKTFVLSPFTDDRGQVFPAAGAFAIGLQDQYVLLDILMPQTYVDAAELELKNAAQAYLDGNSAPRTQYKLTLDAKYFRDRSTPGTITNHFSLGDTVQIQDSDLGINGGSRIITLTRDLLNEYDYTIEIADSYDIGIIQRVLSDLTNVKQVIKINDIRDARRAKYGYQIQQELLGTIFDTDGYFDPERIKPLSIETEMLSVGAKSQQLVLNAIIEPNFGGNPNVVHCYAGTLTHYTIEETIRTWQLPAQHFTIADNDWRYIYVACNKTNYNDAGWSFTKDQIKVNDNNVYYTFLIGVLHAVSTDLGVRWYSLTYGATTINGRFLTTGRIQSADHNTFFDLDLGVIAGNIKFIAADGSSKNVSDVDEDLQAYADAVTGFQTQIDGKVEMFFGNDDPNTWPAADRLKHHHDLWYKYNTQELFSYNGFSNVWDRINDKDAIAAAQTAAQAKDTADGKRRIFTTTPYPPYDVGDLWTQGANGDIMVCVVAKAAGQAYSASDWQKAGKYTGDDAIINFINNTYAGDKTVLQNQIDGKVEAYFGNDDPNTWPAADRIKHNRDLWYKFNTKELFSYNGFSNVWDRIDDANAIAAYEAASHAVDTADGKRRIFTTTPYPPYDVGDLWAQGANGDIKVCVVAKAAGQSYSAGDFAIAAKYTDDTTITNFINNIYYVDQADLKNQIDGKITTYYQVADPNTWPASDRIAHHRDLWYKSDTKQLFSYNGFGNSWDPVQDKDALAAVEIASQAADAVDGKRTIFAVTPYPPYDVGDLWANGVDLRRCINAKVAGQFYDPNDWVMATNYDNTVTTINGGIITSGTIQLAGVNGSILAGITGVGTDNTSVRIWAGASFENRQTAPFQVWQNGEVELQKRVEVFGLNNGVRAGQAGLAGDMGSEGTVRIWAGTYYGNRFNAPFRVYSEGSMYAIKGQIGRFNIQDSVLSNSDNEGFYAVVLQTTQGRFAGIGTNLASAASGSQVVARFENYGAFAGVNIAGYFVAANGSQMSYAIYAQQGTSMLSDALINGQRTLQGTAVSFQGAQAVDPSMYDCIVINPGGSTQASNIEFKSPAIPLNDGKRITVLNDTGAGGGFVFVKNLQRGNANVQLSAGNKITFIYLRGQWYVDNFYANSY